MENDTIAIIGMIMVILAVIVGILIIEIAVIVFAGLLHPALGAIVCWIMIGVDLINIGQIAIAIAVGSSGDW